MRARWLEKGGESFYGCPQSDPRPGASSPGGTTCTVVDFPKREQAIFVEHTSGPLKGQTFVVDECFAMRYRSEGGTSSWLGLPVSNGYEIPGGARQDFENGYMIWTAADSSCRSYKKDEPPPPPGMTLEAKDYRVRAGETVVVPIYLNRATDVANINYTLKYNTSVAAIEGVPTSGNMLGASLFKANAAEPGLLRGAFAGTTGVSGTGTVVNVTFKAVGSPGSKTPLTLAVTTINQPSGSVPKIGLINGSITVLDKNGGEPGDCDGDNTLTVNDALCALEVSVNLRAATPGLDIDTSGDVTSRDATLILQRRAR